MMKEIFENFRIYFSFQLRYFLNETIYVVVLNRLVHSMIKVSRRHNISPWQFFFIFSFLLVVSVYYFTWAHTQIYIVGDLSIRIIEFVESHIRVIKKKQEKVTLTTRVWINVKKSLEKTEMFLFHFYCTI